MARYEHAFATTHDSGKVIDRETGSLSEVDVTMLWVLRKDEDDWRITLTAEGFGSTLMAARGNIDEGVAQFLSDDARAFEPGTSKQSSAFIMTLFSLDLMREIQRIRHCGRCYSLGVTNTRHGPRREWSAFNTL